MKDSRSLVMLVIALLAGLAAVFLAGRWMQQQSGDNSGRIAVAMADIQPGSRLTPELMHMVSWPSGSIPSGAFRDPAELDGRVAKTGLARGEPILESKLAPVGTKGGLSAVVGEGRRAITVRVNDVVGVAGFALPGNYVDIMVNTQEEGAKANDKNRAISKIVLEHILVLAVAQESSRDETKPKVVNAVTLEVTPEEAEKLDLARSVGTLSLVLRNQVDLESAKSTGATKESLLGGQQAPAVRTAEPAKERKIVRRSGSSAPTDNASRTCVEVIRGASKSMECF